MLKKKRALLLLIIANTSHSYIFTLKNYRKKEKKTQNARKRKIARTCACRPFAVGFFLSSRYICSIAKVFFLFRTSLNRDHAFNRPATKANRRTWSTSELSIAISIRNELDATCSDMYTSDPLRSSIKTHFNDTEQSKTGVSTHLATDTEYISS